MSPTRFTAAPSTKRSMLSRGDGVAGLEGGEHGGCAFGFEADDFCRGRIGFEEGAGARGEAAATDGDEEVVDLWQVFEYFDCDGALAFDDPEVFEGGDKGHAFFLCELAGGGVAVVECIA